MQKETEFTLIYNSYKTQLYNYALRMTKDRMAAADIIQSAFEKFYLNMDNIIKPESIKYWLYTSVRNLINAHYRKLKIRREDEIEDHEITDEYSLPETLLASKEIREAVTSAVDSLQTDLREVFVLREYSGMTYAEIASALTIEEKLVKSRLFYARRKLMKYLSGKV